MPSPSSDPTTRPLDAVAASIVVVLCLSWGFNQVATKLAIHEIPPLIQATIRSVVAAMIVAGWCRLRGIPLLSRDGSLQAGLAAGFFFGLEFIFIFQGLSYTTALRATLFIYLAPFFVVLGGRIFLPQDKFSAAQWLGLLLSFAGMIVAFGLPTPALDPHQALGDFMMVAGAIFWATTTLIIKSRLGHIPAEKVMLYQLVVSAPMLGIGALVGGERIVALPSSLAIGALAYQTIWVVSVTFVIWFALIARYSANRLSVFSFLTPLFGVAAGHFVLGEPLTPAFGAAVALVAAGLVLVNKAK
jgi:drug/metabolite transporter (DMT)-like permease